MAYETDVDRALSAGHVPLRPEVLLLGALGGVVAYIGPIFCLLLAVALVDQHDFAADTLSALGNGPYSAIMDTGFYIGAGGSLALAIGAAHGHLGKIDWSAGVLCLALIALTSVLLGIWDEFHTEGDNPPGLSVHTRISFAMGPLYLLGPLLMARGAAGVHRGHAVAFITAAALWIVFATAFKLAPNSIDGLMEKLAFAATGFWLLPLSWILFGVARRC
jgi:hypothetical membrane protein